MPAIEIGRVCAKNAGKDAGKFCVVVEILKNGFVEITGPKKLNDIKRKRCNIMHLEATNESIAIKKNDTDAVVEKAIEKAKLTEKFKDGVKFK